MKWKGTMLTKGCKVLCITQCKEKSGQSKVEIGMPWSTEEFVAQAKGVMHPFDKQIKVPPAVAQVIFNIATKGPRHIAADRENCLQWYTKVADSLREQEADVHAKLHPNVEKVVSDKKILLFRRMLQDIHYDDMAVADFSLL